MCVELLCVGGFAVIVVERSESRLPQSLLRETCAFSGRLVKKYDDVPSHIAVCCLSSVTRVGRGERCVLRISVPEPSSSEVGLQEE